MEIKFRLVILFGLFPTLIFLPACFESSSHGSPTGNSSGSPTSNQGPDSGPVISATPAPSLFVPSIPSSLLAQGGAGEISLSWNAVAGATSYNIYRGTSSGSEATTAIGSALTGASFIDTGLSPGTTYYYEVSAVNSVGDSAKSNEASASTSTSSSGTETFTNTDPVASLSSISPPSGMSNLDASDFTYLGVQSAGGWGYNWVFGLAYHSETNTFFSIAQNGFPNFDLIEYSNTGPGGQFQVVKDWGNINTNNILQLPVSDGSYSMQGLWWDDANQRLWISWGNYYNADQTNDQVLAYVTLDTGTPVAHGPWGVTASVGSDRVKSEITAAPSQLASITGNPWLMFGGTSSTDQNMSFGAGLVSVADPSQLPAGSLTSAEKLIDWPMQGHTYFDSANNKNFYDFYSDFPTGASVIAIHGNEDVTPPSQLSYQYNGLIADGQHYIEGDGLSNYAWVDSGGAEGFIYVGRAQSGYQWYGNNNAHDDTSAAGQQYQNDMTSLANPGQPLVDLVATGRGNHTDQWQYNVYFINYQDVLNTATAVKNGTATAATLQIAPSSIASLKTLGGTVPIGNLLYNMSSFFDPITDNYYLLSPNMQQIFIWHVAPTK